jgi:hypothetical protein
MTNKTSCGGSTCHGHGEYAVCGKPYIGGIYYCHKCQLKDLELGNSELLNGLMKIRDSLLLLNQDPDISKHIKFTWEIDLALSLISKYEVKQ